MIARPKPNLPLLTHRLKIGITFIYLAGLGWAAEFIIPFTHVSHQGLIWIIVLVSAEISFIAGVATLGKPAYSQLKQQLIAFIRSRNR